MIELKRVCVFCGSNKGTRPAYAEAARRMGTTLAQRGIGLVYGAGNISLVVQATDPDGLLGQLARYEPPILDKWIDRSER